MNLAQHCRMINSMNRAQEHYDNMLPDEYWWPMEDEDGDADDTGDDDSDMEDDSGQV